MLLVLRPIGREQCEPLRDRCWIENLVRGKFLDVHVLETENPHRGDEAGLAVHIPYPCVGHFHFNEWPCGVASDVHLHFVGQVEPAFRFDGVLKHADDILVFLREFEFAVRLKVVEIIGIHNVSRRFSSGVLFRVRAFRESWQPYQRDRGGSTTSRDEHRRDELPRVLQLMVHA